MTCLFRASAAFELDEKRFWGKSEWEKKHLKGEEGNKCGQPVQRLLLFQEVAFLRLALREEADVSA